MPLVTSSVPLQDEDTINTVEEQSRLKDIPVPLSLPEDRAAGIASFELPQGTFIMAPGPNPIPGVKRRDLLFRARFQIK